MIFQHHRFQIWGSVQHPYKHSLAEFTYTNPALPTDQPQNVESALNWIFAVLYPQSQPAVATPAALPAAGNTLNDYRVVLDDGDGKAAAYRWEQREGDVAAQWYKIYDMDWGESSILSNFLVKTQDVYAYKYGHDDVDASGTPLAGVLKGQFLYGGATAGGHFTLYANSGDGVGAGTGYVQVGDNFRPIADNSYTAGTATERWSHIYTVLATVDTMSISTGSITDSTGAISFGDENLSTTGTLTVGPLLFNGQVITSTTGTIGFGDENLTTTGSGTFNSVTATGASSSFATGTTIGNLTLGNGSITDSSGSISFGNENLSTTGTLGAGVTTVTQLNVDDVRIDGNTINVQTADTDLNINANGTGQVKTSSDVVGTGFAQFSTVFAGNLSLSGNAITSTDTDGHVFFSPNGTGDVVSDAHFRPLSTASNYDLGETGFLWNNLYMNGSIGDGTTTIASSVIQSFRDVNSGVADGHSIFWDGGAGKWVSSAPDTEIDHGSISGLGDDDHTQYALLLGRAGGQVLIGGTAASNNLTLTASSHGTDGNIIFTSILRPDDDGLTDIGTASNRVHDIYMGGEGIGFRMQNVANVGALPTPSASNKGRIAWVDDINSIYVDDGGVWVLATNTQNTGVWTKYTVTFSDLSDTDMDNDIELFSLAAATTIEEVIIKPQTLFTGGSINAYTLSVGVSGNLDKYASEKDVHTLAVSGTNFQFSSNKNLEDFGSATSIRVRAQSENDNLDQAGAGSADIWVRTSTLP